MDAGYEYTMLAVGAEGKFVVIAVGARCTASCYFALRDERCQRCQGLFAICRC